MDALVQTLEQIHERFLWLSSLPIEGSDEEIALISISATSLVAITNLAIKYYGQCGPDNVEQWEIELTHSIDSAQQRLSELVVGLQKSMSFAPDAANHFSDIRELFETWLRRSTDSGKFVDWLVTRKKPNSPPEPS